MAGWAMGADAPAHMMIFWGGLAVFAAVVLLLALLALLAALRPARRRAPHAAAAFDPARPARRHRPRIGPWRDGIEGPPADFVFLIPDISGYTQLVKPSRFSIAHAHHIVHDLLDALIAAAAPFKPARIEGDAVLLYVDAATLASDPKRYSAAVTRLFDAFDTRLAELRAENSCPCAACSRIDSLDLKMIAHRGEAVRFAIGAMEDFTGEVLVEAHRMLKNDVGRKRYLLASEAALQVWPHPTAGAARPRPQTYPDVGEIPARLFDAPPRAGDPDRPAGGVRKMLDLQRKVRAAIKAAA
ncbi:MAG: DUF2652 domain-containing protein [Marivibrio sp.]|uniref:DUF2652 domain-containing protein n=1 Tax=Marivibrio sp. TaxID=2039719 RepID=UPI0032EB1156